MKPTMRSILKLAQRAGSPVFFTYHEHQPWLLTCYFGVRLSEDGLKVVTDLWHACNLKVEPMAVRFGGFTLVRDPTLTLPKPISDLVPTDARQGTEVREPWPRVLIRGHDQLRAECWRRSDGTWPVLDPHWLEAIRSLGLSGTWLQDPDSLNAPLTCWDEAVTDRLNALVMPIRWSPAALEDVDFPPLFSLDDEVKAS